MSADVALICGSEVVVREVEGCAAEIVLCQATHLPCRWSDTGRVGLRGNDDCRLNLRAIAISTLSGGADDA